MEAGAKKIATMTTAELKMFFMSLINFVEAKVGLSHPFAELTKTKNRNNFL
jgi:hypothetical protein